MAGGRYGVVFFFQAEDGIRDTSVTGVQTCALPILVRSTIRLFEDEGISDATARQLFPLIAFGPPIVFYAARIWPEVPAAFCFVEAVRGVRQRRAVRWVAALLGLVLLKLRFGLIAMALLLRQVAPKATGEGKS